MNDSVKRGRCVPATINLAAPLKAALLASALCIAWAIHPAPASAQSHSGGGHSGGGGKSGGSHSDGDSHSDDGHEEGGESGHTGGRGKGGKGIEDRVFRGGQGGRSAGGVEDRVFRGQGGGSEGGSRPPWAGGGVPETVELGRLNVARSPDHVLNRALDEAYATNLDKNADGVLDADASIGDVESPMQNLALYKEALAGARKVSGTWSLQDAAKFLGKAADKNIPVTEDTVRAIGVILETPADLTGFTYDRAATHPQDLGVVFNNAGYSGSGAAAFAQAADDARAVIKFHHDNPE